jgi:hypothetical protein
MFLGEDMSTTDSMLMLSVRMRQIGEILLFFCFCPDGDTDRPTAIILA